MAPPRPSPTEQTMDAAHVGASAAALDRAWGRHRLTRQQINALAMYGSFLYKHVNKVLRAAVPPTETPQELKTSLYDVLMWQNAAKGQVMPRLCEAADVRLGDVHAMTERMGKLVTSALSSIVAAFDAAPSLPHGAVLFRGESEDRDGTVEIIDAKVGHEIVLHGFISTSVDPRVVRKFVGGPRSSLVVLKAARGVKVPFLPIFRVPGAETPHHVIPGIGVQHEMEVLLPDRMRVRVTSKSKGDRGSFSTVHGEIVGVGGGHRSEPVVVAVDLIAADLEKLSRC